MRAQVRFLSLFVGLCLSLSALGNETLWPDRFTTLVPPEVEAPTYGQYKHYPLPDGRILTLPTQYSRSNGHIYGLNGELELEREGVALNPLQGKLFPLKDINRLVYAKDSGIQVFECQSLRKLDEFRITHSQVNRVLDDGSVFSLDTSKFMLHRLDGVALVDQAVEVPTGFSAYEYYHLDDNSFAIARKNAASHTRLYCYEYRTGALRWSKQYTTSGNAFDSIMSDGEGGYLIFRTNSATWHILERVDASGNRIWQQTPTELYRGAATDPYLGRDHPFRVVKGKLIVIKSNLLNSEAVRSDVRSLETGAVEASYVFPAASFAETSVNANGQLFIYANSLKRRVVGLDLLQGTTVLDQSFGAPTTLQAVHSLPYPVIATTSRQVKLYSYDLANGARRWTSVVEMPYYTVHDTGRFTGQGDRLLFSTAEDKSHALLNDDLQVLHEAPLGQKLQSTGRERSSASSRFLIDSNSRSYFVIEEQLFESRIVCHDLDTGKTKWTRHYPYGFVFNSRVQKGALEVLSGTGLSRYDISNGQQVAWVPFGQYAGTAASFSDQGYMQVVDVQGRLVRFDALGNPVLVGPANVALRDATATFEGSAGNVASIFLSHPTSRVGHFQGSSGGLTAAILQLTNSWMLRIGDQIVVGLFGQTHYELHGYDLNTWQRNFVIHTPMPSSSFNQYFLSTVEDADAFMFSYSTTDSNRLSGSLIYSKTGRLLESIEAGLTGFHRYAKKNDNGTYTVFHSYYEPNSRDGSVRATRFIPSTNLALGPVSVLQGINITTDTSPFIRQDGKLMRVRDANSPSVEAEFSSAGIEAAPIRMQVFGSVNDPAARCKLELYDRFDAIYREVGSVGQEPYDLRIQSGPLEWDRYVDPVTKRVIARISAVRTGPQTAPIPLTLGIDYIRVAAVP